MEFITVLLIAVGLSVDSFAVSTASGCILQSSSFWQRFKVAIVLAVFQGSMPVIGWLIGHSFSEYIEQIDHWLAFGLLSFIGLKMVYDGYSSEEIKKINPLKTKTLITLGLATSIDALIIGVTFSFIHMKIFVPALVIGIVTFIFSYVGVYFGFKISKKLKFKVEYIGGIILFLLGLKILIEHTLLS